MSFSCDRRVCNLCHASAYNFPKDVASRTTQKLANGIDLWVADESESMSQSTTGQQACPELDIINANQTSLSYALGSGQYLMLQAGYCEGQRATTSLTYQQQLASQDWQGAINVVGSVKIQ